MRLLDKITAKRIRDGDVEAFEEFIHKYQDKLFSYCFRLVGNFHIAEELAQETFLKFYRSIASYDYMKAGLATWLFRIARNTCLNYLRSDIHDWTCEAGKLPGAAESPEDLYLAAEEHRELFMALQKLSLEGREMILMKDYLGFSCRELASIFQIPTGTVKSRLHKLRGQLRELMVMKYD